jgi:hypothetical protein
MMNINFIFFYHNSLQFKGPSFPPHKVIKMLCIILHVRMIHFFNYYCDDKVGKTNTFLIKFILILFLQLKKACEK